MKRILIALTAILVTSIGSVMAQGIDFKKGTFEEIQKIAQKEGKLIFIDVFTTWCGPCKMLDKSVFPKKEVGDFINANFVALKIDAEKEGKLLAEKYKVNSYPTMLYLLPNGELVFKTVGACDASGLIVDAQKAITLVNDPNRLSELKKRYESEKNNEQFMLMFIEKKMEMKENPAQAIEYFLSYQKGIKHRDVDMMEFMLKYDKYFLCNTNAEKIYLANIDEYLDIATRSEARAISGVRRNMVRSSRRVALYKHDTELYKGFIKGWSQLDEKDRIYADDINHFNVELLSIGDDEKLLKKEAVKFLDSLVDSKSVEKIIQDDLALYEQAKAKYKGRTDMFAAAFIRVSKNLNAVIRVNTFTAIGKEYLKVAKKKKEYKLMAKWIDFGKVILPADYRMTSLEADVLYVSGKDKEAIKVKKDAMNILPKGHRDIKKIAKELSEMENGTFVIR